MKKTLVTAITTALVVGAASTTFAAANPYSDVPSDNWAYGAVAKLSQDGLISGYGDGTFRGNQTLTRYEMAQITANAITKEDKANAEDKATIDKLANEYRDELSSLGVRVGKLEANQPVVKFTGDLRVRATSDGYDQDTKASTVASTYRLRLDATAAIDDNTTAAFRFVTREPDKSKFGNDTWQSFGGNAQDDKGTSGSGNGAIDRVNLTSKLGHSVSTTIGRQALNVDKYSMLVDSGAFSYDGISFAGKTGTYNVNASYGRFINGATFANSQYTALFANLDVMSLGASTTQGKLAYGLSYFDFVNNSPSVSASYNPSRDNSSLKWTIANLNYNFTPKLSLNAEFAHNGGTSLNASENGKNVWQVNSIIGAQKLAQKGDNNVTLTYVDAGGSSMIGPLSTLPITINDRAADFKEYIIDYNYAFSKAYTATLEYAKLTSSVDSAATPENQQQYRLWFDAKF
jgi:hypothetical protein